MTRLLNQLLSQRTEEDERQDGRCNARERRRISEERNKLEDDFDDFVDGAGERQ